MSHINAIESLCNNKDDDPLGLSRMIKIHHDFPRSNVCYYDISPIFLDPYTIDNIMNYWDAQLGTYNMSLSNISRSKQGRHPIVVVGLEARGFVIGGCLASKFSLPFVPLRKGEKLPGECSSIFYDKEYGTDMWEIQKDAIPTNESVILCDDLLATGGSAEAAVKLVKSVGGNVSFLLCIIEIKKFEARNILESMGIKCISAIRL